MRHTERFASILSAILLLASASFGQRSGGPPGQRFQVLGNVTDEADHKPIQGAQARLSTATGEMMVSAMSRPNGDFRFENLTIGDYTVVLSADGYETVQESFSLRSITEFKLDVSLRKSLEPRREGGVAEKAVSAGELSLPAKARDALTKGKERLYQKHDFAGSLSYFQKVLELSPGFYEAYYDEGVAYTFLLKPADAEEAFHKSIAASENHYADPCFALASLLTDEKQFAEAEKFAREGLNVQPDAWRGHYELARALLGQGHPAEAEKSGLEARKRKTDFPGLYLILANIHMKLHNNEAVLEDVNTFLKLEPEGPASGQARQIKEQMERALGHSPVPPSLQD